MSQGPVQLWGQDLLWTQLDHLGRAKGTLLHFRRAMVSSLGEVGLLTNSWVLFGHFPEVHTHGVYSRQNLLGTWLGLGINQELVQLTEEMCSFCLCKTLLSTPLQNITVFWGSNTWEVL